MRRISHPWQTWELPAQWRTLWNSSWDSWPSPLTFQIQSDLCGTQIFTELLIRSRCCAGNWEHIQGICNRIQQPKPSAKSPKVLVKILVSRPCPQPESEVWGQSLKPVGLGGHPANGSPLVCVHGESFCPLLQIMAALPSERRLLPREGKPPACWLPANTPSTPAFHKEPRFLAKANEPLEIGLGHVAFK